MFSPETVNLLLKATLCLITFSLGFSVSKNEFREVFQHPKALTLGLMMQMLGLPIIAGIIAYSFPLSVNFKMGIFLIALCPGGTTANLLSYLFRANVALSISLTALNGMLCLVSIPLFIQAGFYLFQINSAQGAEIIVFSTFQTFLDLLIIIIIPGFIGVALNSKFPNIAKRMQQYLKWILPLCLFFIFGIKFFASPENGGLVLTKSDILVLILPLIVLNFSSTLISFLICRWRGIRFYNCLTVAIEVGLQNTGLALFLAAGTGILDIQKPALIYAGFSFFSTLTIIALINYWNKKRRALQSVPKA